MTYDHVPRLGQARPATEIAHVLAEGPIWGPSRERILWVDIMEGAVHTGRLLPDRRIEPIGRIDVTDTAGAVAVAGTGELVIAGTHRLYYVANDGTISSGRPLIDGDDRRFNDGKPDPAGRLVVGTKGPGSEILVRIEPGERVRVLDDDLTLSNGLGWSVDGHLLYSVDTLSRRIHIRDYDPETGTTGERSVFAEIPAGYPDGLAVDADDHLWVAIWGEGCVLRIAPTGGVVGKVDVPAPHVSCPAFVGPDLDVLVISTATEDLTPALLDDHPLSGRLFTFAPGVRGAAPRLWAGHR